MAQTIGGWLRFPSNYSENRTVWTALGRKGVHAIFRLLDSGLDTGRRHVAIDAALARLHADGRVGDTIRLFRFAPTVLVGRHQALRREVHVEQCLAEGVGLARRLTGGGAIYLDEGQICWEIVCSRRSLGVASLAHCAERICNAVAAGLARQFGIDARYRPQGEVEVGGRKLCGSAGSFFGDTLLYQGTVLVAFDRAHMLRYLNVPAPAVQEQASRIVTLRDLLGQAPPPDEVERAVVAGMRDGLGLETASAAPAPLEAALAARILAEEVGSDEFVFGPADAVLEDALFGCARGGCGVVQAYVRLEGDARRRRIREIVFAGDFQIEPVRALYDLEASLRGLRAGDAPDAVSRQMDGTGQGRGADLPATFRQALTAALAKDAGCEVA